MLGAFAVPAPPEHPDAFPRVVEPRLSHGFSGRETVLGSSTRAGAGFRVRPAPIPLKLFEEGPDKIDRSIGVVVGGEITVRFHVPRHVSVNFTDPFVGPDRGLDGSAEPYTDVLSQKTGVDAFEIIVGNGRHGMLRI